MGEMETANSDKALQAAKPSPYTNGQPVIVGGVRAAKAVARDEGTSAITIWRRVRAGLLTSVNIAGRPYITLESLAEFYRRAAAGEFAKPPPGAARKSAEARADRERSDHDRNGNHIGAAEGFLTKPRGRRNTA
jgi:hypothetical protein